MFTPRHTSAPWPLPSKDRPEDAESELTANLAGEHRNQTAVDDDAVVAEVDSQVLVVTDDQSGGRPHA